MEDADHIVGPSTLISRLTLLMRNGKGNALLFLGVTCPLLAILARVRNGPGLTRTRRLKFRVNVLRPQKTGVRGDLRQGQAASRLQELFGALDTVDDDVLVGRQAVVRFNCWAK